MALYWPNLSDLEESVREQITEQQNALTVVAKNPATSTTELSEAFGKLGQLYHAYSLVSPARDCYFNANYLAPNDFRWIYLSADLDRQTGRVVDGIRRYRLARTLRPDYIAAPVNLGNMFLGMNRLDEARASFLAALEIDKNDPAAHYGLGEIALSERNYSEAIQHFNTTLARVPNANRVHYSLAMAYRGLGDVEKVKAHLAQQGPVGVRVSDPLINGLQDLVESERVHLARGKMAFEARQYTEAAIEYRKAVAANPDSVTARINLGATLSHLGDAMGAIEQFEAALRLEPDRVNAHFNLAILFARQNKHHEAISHLQIALRVDPNDPGVQSLLIQELGTLADLGRCSEANDWLRRIIAIAEQPHNAELAAKLKKLFEQPKCRPNRP
ncbi:MAG TPA: tetratricopeptide repeat protein [Pyrinomonadaceae bacterium]|nr:tetratricopeptide repeat protein [Pyrinomonadaceae bacterium]